MLPHPHWRTLVSLEDTKKWQKTPHKEELVKWVKETNKGKGVQDMETNGKQKEVCVTTRSKLQTHPE